MKSPTLFCKVLAILLLITPAISRAADRDSNETCPVGLVSGLTLSAEFGSVVAANTRCIKARHHVRTMFVLDNTFSPGTTTAYGLPQVQNALNDYEITDGLTEGRDFRIIVVVHSAGGRLMLNDPAENPFVGTVQHLMSEGVTFYLCENTIRAMISHGLLQEGNVGAGVISGTKFVTSAVTAIPDFETVGWHYVQP